MRQPPPPARGPTTRTCELVQCFHLYVHSCPRTFLPGSTLGWFIDLFSRTVGSAAAAAGESGPVSRLLAPLLPASTASALQLRGVDNDATPDAGTRWLRDERLRAVSRGPGTIHGLTPLKDLDDLPAGARELLMHWKCNSKDFGSREDGPHDVGPGGTLG